MYLFMRVFRTERDARHVILNCPSSELTPAVQAISGNATASETLSITQAQQVKGAAFTSHTVCTVPISIRIQGLRTLVWLSCAL